MMKNKSILTALCEAVAAKYQEEGDQTKAGVVVACLSYDPLRFYASIARYPDGPYGKKKIVASTSRAGGYVTVEEAVEVLAQEWYSMVRPAPVKDNLDQLGSSLGQLRKGKKVRK